MNNPFIWLGISILLVSISLIALLTVAILTLQELARAARSAEKLLDTLNRELPATLSDLRLTGKELSDLTDEVSGSVQSARSIVEQVDRGIVDAKVQAKKAQITSHSLFVGANAALKVLIQSKPRRRRRPPTRRPASPISPPKTASSTLVPKEGSANLPNSDYKTSERNTEKLVKKPAEEANPTSPLPRSPSP